MKAYELLTELKAEVVPEAEIAIKKIEKVMSAWDNHQTNYLKTGAMGFSAAKLLIHSEFTDKDVKNFRKREGFKNVKTPEDIKKVAQGIQKSKHKAFENDVSKLDAILKPFHGTATMYEESDRYTVMIHLGGMVRFV